MNIPKTLFWLRKAYRRLAEKTSDFLDTGDDYRERVNLMRRRHGLPPNHIPDD